MIDVVYCPGKRKPKRRTKNSQRNPRDRKTNEVVYLGNQPEHPRDRLRRKTKNTVEKTLEEDEVIYLGT